MRNLIEELKKYPDCEMMVALHERLTAEIDGYISEMWGYFKFVRDDDGSFVAPFPEGPEIGKIVKIVPQLQDIVTEIEGDAETIIELMDAHRSVEELMDRIDRVESIIHKYEELYSSVGWQSRASSS